MSLNLDYFDKIAFKNIGLVYGDIQTECCRTHRTHFYNINVLISPYIII